MILELDEALLSEYNRRKEHFLKKIANGYRHEEVELMRSVGISDDVLFISEMLGIYQASIELGLV